MWSHVCQMMDQQSYTHIESGQGHQSQLCVAIMGPDTFAKVIKGGSLTVFQKFSRPSWTKLSEISINTVENIDEIDQIFLLNT